MTLTATPELCPNCQVSLVTDADETPWCERCEWNLDFAQPDPGRGPVGRMLDRWAFRVGFASNRRLFKEISSRPIRRPEITPAFLLLLGVSLLLIGIFVSAIVSGIFLVIDGILPLKLLGLVLLALAFFFRPRLGRLKYFHDQYDEVTRGNAPHLFALLDRAADSLGARRVDHVFVGPEWNASASVVGLRRRKVLLLGLPLWVSSRPQERVFLLGHELGHFVNRDVRRGLLTQPACTMFGSLADLVRPDKAGGVHLDDAIGVGLLTKLANMIARPLLWILTYVLFFIHIGLTMLAARDGQRAEYYADALAIELAGTKASPFLDLLNDSFLTVVGARARGNHGFRGLAHCGGTDASRPDGASRPTQADKPAPGGFTLLRAPALRSASSDVVHGALCGPEDCADRGGSEADRRRAREVREVPPADRGPFVVKG